MAGDAEEARKKRQGGTHDVPRLRSFRTVTRHMCAKVRPQAMSFTTLFSRADGTHDGPKELSSRSLAELLKYVILDYLRALCDASTAIDVLKNSSGTDGLSSCGG